MRTRRSIGISVFALATTASILQAEVLADKYAPLIGALSGKRQAAVAGAKDARFWTDEYGKIIEDPDTEEKLALRKTHILEQARARTLTAETAQLDAAIRGLRGLPVQPSFHSVMQVKRELAMLLR